MGYPRFTALPKNGWWFFSHFKSDRLLPSRRVWS